MKLNIKKIATIVLLHIGVPLAVFSQPNVDVVMTGGPNLGTYPGYPASGNFTLNFSNNNQPITLPAGSFDIVIVLPEGYFQFNTTYPNIPAGWSYFREDLNVVHLTPTSAVSNVPPASIVHFEVPFSTIANTTSPQPYAASIQQPGADFNETNDDNNSPQGTVSVSNTPLPLEFKNFNVTQNNCTSKLTWETGLEKNNAYFSVERSATGTNDFKSIGKVEHVAENKYGGKYSFEDAKPLKGKNFYRIRQVDVDGKSTTTKVQDVTIKCGTERIDLFPNPTTNVVNVRGLEGKNTIKVLSVAGQEVLMVKSEKEIESIPVSILAAGTYNVQVVKENEIIFNGKFVKSE